MVNGFLPKLIPNAVHYHCAEPIGIERQRRQHFIDFYQRESFTHLYLTDSDAIHAPDAMAQGLWLQEKYKAPVCLYNTAAHERLVGNTIGEEGDTELSRIVWRQFAPGISYLLTREHAYKVIAWLLEHPTIEHWSFDWQIPTILGNRFAISKHSYVDHIGAGGMHHDGSEGYEGGDRCLNPKEWLVQKRAEVVAKLQGAGK